MTDSVHFALSGQAIDPSVLQVAVRDPHCGGFASFEGWVRDHQDGRRVAFLEYEAYPALCAKEGTRILREAVERFGIRRASAVHRTGRLEIGEVAVWIGVSSAHRREALRACEWIIDEIKASLPVWKKETFADGAHEWVRCERCAQGHAHHEHARDGAHHHAP